MAVQLQKFYVVALHLVWGISPKDPQWRDLTSDPFFPIPPSLPDETLDMEIWTARMT